MKFLKKNKETILLVCILLIAAFLRLYRIGDYLTFLGDEGRDVLVVKHILEGHLVLLGPRSSAADFYQGPIYYYMMAPFLWLSHLDPVGPAIMIALFSLATTYLIYRFGKEWFGTTAALIAASLYSVSPLVLQYSRSSWNPNPMPFFTLLLLYLLYKGVTKGKYWLLFISGILYGVALQLHVIELFVGVIIFFFTTVSAFLVPDKKPFLSLLKRYAVILAGFLIGFSLFLLFEIRHGFPNTITIINFILHGNPTALDVTHTSFGYRAYDVFSRVFGRLLLRYPQPEHIHEYTKSVLSFWHLAGVVLGIICVAALLRHKDRIVQLLLGSWLLFGVVLFGFYSKPIYDYYYEFLYPLPFLLFGYALSLVTSQKRIKKFGILLVSIITIALMIFNLFGSALRMEPNKQKEQTKHIAEFVLSKTDNKPFNFALLTKGNSDHAYRYYFEVLGKPPVVINNTLSDPQRKTVTDQLLVVCEDLGCRPLGNPLFEVAGFGRADIVGVWDYSVVKIYKLIHYTGR